MKHLRQEWGILLLLAISLAMVIYFVVHDWVPHVKVWL